MNDRSRSTKPLTLGACLVGLLLATGTTAQCRDLAAGTPIPTWNWTFVNDDGISATHIPIGFDFPIAGAAAATFSHVRVGSNGWILLTDGTNSTGMPAASTGGYGSVANNSNGLAGSTGDFPLIAPFWGDLMWTGGNGNGVSTWHGFNRFTVTWRNVTDYGSNPATTSTFAVELFASGEVRCHYVADVDNRSVQGLTTLVGLSARNNQFVPAPMDLFPALGNSSSGLAWQGFPVGLFDGASTSLILTPHGNGWNSSVCSGTPAQTSPYGTGCYDLPRSGFYREFADAEEAARELPGNVLLLNPTGNGYQSFWLPGTASATFVQPSANATTLFVGDNGATSVWLPTSFTTPDGQANSLTVHANGIVSVGYWYQQPFDSTPTGAEFAAASLAAFCSWHDFDPSEAGSGQVKSEFVGSTLCITWDGVENLSEPPLNNRSTMQFQFDLASGIVQMIWLSIDDDTSSGNGSAFLVGVKGSGPVSDAGSQALDGSPSLTSYWRQPLQLASNTPLVYGTTANFLTLRVPEFQPGSGIYVAMHIMSTSQNPGTDLGLIGAPGCAGYVGSLDFAIPMIGSTSTLTSSLTLPNQGISGLQLFSQAIALVGPGLVAEPQNVLGLVTSNGLAHTLNHY